MKIKNAQPQFFYGLHFQSGVAEYKDMEDEPVFYIGPDVARSMDASFRGKPVYVLHENDVDYSNVTDADGIVVRSFYNKADGNHWAEFAVWTDEAASAFKNGWVLSNSYVIISEKGSGTWHGVSYDREVVSADYDHLAIVPNPRYADSKVFTPEQFKQYNLEKEEELIRLTNSKGDKPMFKLFKKEKVKNSDELLEMSVMLPKSKIEKSITQLINEADELENEDSMIKVGNEEISLKELKNFYVEQKKKMENEEDNEELENEEDEEKPENKEDIENEEDEEEVGNEDDKKDALSNALKEVEKLSNEVKALKEKKENFKKLKNAHLKDKEVEIRIETSQDRVSRGKDLYGSK